MANTNTTIVTIKASKEAIDFLYEKFENMNDGRYPNEGETPHIADVFGADAELFIVHNNIAGTGNLIICVPIIIGSSNIDTTSIFDDLMMKISNTANSVGKQTTLINNNFSLNKFIPNKPFFSYSGTLPYSPCNGIYDYIVLIKKIP